MDIIISNRSAQTIYEQIIGQVKRQIADGLLAPGEPIPSMRALARQLHISVITVQKAYELLQRDGFIETVQGKGTFISGASRDFILEERLRRIEEHLDAAAQAAREADIPLDKLTDILRLFYEQEDQNI
ncbi:MAG: GntR family transcriptional regulator [Clostridiales bacterium]|nr:GntR family transcriptional regulator [Clostridiales bacterium]